MKKIKKIQHFINHILFMNQDIGQACLTIKKLLNEAPYNTKTRFKNAIHRLNTTDRLTKIWIGHIFVVVQKLVQNFFFFFFFL